MPCSASEQLRESTRGDADVQPRPQPAETGEPQRVLTLANMVRQADQMENEALRRFHLLRDLGPATGDFT